MFSGNEWSCVLITNWGPIVGGGPAGELMWHRGRPCDGGACIEIAALPDAIMVRSTANPDGAIFAMSRDEWQEFLAGAKAGFFDEV
jgi:hypothetical protein